MSFQLTQDLSFLNGAKLRRLLMDRDCFCSLLISPLETSYSIHDVSTN
jgi:hypothetical protein